MIAALMVHPDDETLPAPTERESEAPTSSRLSRVGDYLVSAPIAEGGFGQVFEAEHIARGGRVALKIPHAELASIPQVVARFEREIDAIRRLDHPSVVRILDTGRLPDGRPWLAMELLRGVDLSAHLAARGRLPVDEAVAILEPVCAALEAAHAQSLVHRDIKPSNVFLAEAGGERRVVLLDFGVAKLLDGSGPDLTASRQIIGTLGYLSPEQLLGRPVDHRTDIYGLGALLFAMLVGRPPIAPAAQPVMLQLLLHGSVPRPSLQAPVSPAFDEVILRAMSRDSAARHSSAAAFLAHVRAAAGIRDDRSAPTVAPPEGERRALGIYLEVLTDPGALDAPDPGLLDDIESILPAAGERLRADGLDLAIETGTSALFVLRAPAPPILADAARLRVIAAALSLHEALRGRPGRDARVRVHLSAHTAAIPGGEEGAPLAGELLDLPAWTPDDPEEGVFASGPMLEGLAQVVRRAGPDPGKPGKLFRLA